MKQIIKKKVRFTVLGIIISTIRLNLFRRKIIKKYRDNDIIPMNIFPEDCLSMGRYSYGELNIVTFNDKTKLKIGNFVSIAQHVNFLLDVEHHIDRISTFPFNAKVLNNVVTEGFSKGDIVVDDDVWIGYGATILSGVHIGKGAVIAAGAVVTRDVEPYSVVGGIPAVCIKHRFSEELITELMKVDYSQFTIEKIRNNLDKLDSRLVSIEQINSFLH